jgi:isopentenyl-diphosphate delta-isomerase
MSEQRKKDHIDLTFKSQIQDNILDGFHYEPLLGSHQKNDLSLNIFGHKLLAPLWVSSMTGGTEKAKLINTNLARACGKYGLGMGLGSCRSLLDSNDRIEDFDVKKYLNEYPLFANLGVAQLEQLIANNKLSKINELLDKLSADGLILHINPLQEAMQEEGDFLNNKPLDSLKILLDNIKDRKIIIKEVGQGFGPKSLKILLELPISGIELAGFGGTNFTYLEHARHSKSESGTNEPLKTFAHVGHTASEMVSWMNQFKADDNSIDKDIIISGGIKSLLDGYFLSESCKLNSIIGFASSYLKYALLGEDILFEFVENQIKALNLAQNYLKRE